MYANTLAYHLFRLLDVVRRDDDRRLLRLRRQRQQVIPNSKRNHPVGKISRSQSYQTFFLSKRRIFPFFADTLDHFS